MLTAHFHRRSMERHALELRVGEGPSSLVELETRSFLVHDLVHFCVEAELGTDDGFWGLLARGVPLQLLNDREQVTPDARFDAGVQAGLMRIEGLVGPLQSYLQGHVTRAQVEQVLGALTGAQLEAIERRFRTVLGAWKATPVGGRLRVTWPPSSPAVEAAQPQR